jgi:hypothetical protein
MRLTDYHKLRRGVQANAVPAPRGELVSLERTLHRALEATGAFHDIEVATTDDADRLLIAMCRFRPELDERAVAGLLDRIWTDSLQHAFWEAHATQVTPAQVELQGATRSGLRGGYTTVHVVAQGTRVPAQRSSR